jgi:hypothetical protein
MMAAVSSLPDVATLPASFVSAWLLVREGLRVFEEPAGAKATMLQRSSNYNNNAGP